MFATVISFRSARFIREEASRLLGVPVTLTHAVDGESVMPAMIQEMHPGEYGLKQSYLNAISSAERSGASLAAIFDDDVGFHYDAKYMLKALKLSECWDFLAHPGGVLLLGASDWTQYRGNPPNGTCYSVYRTTMGSFAQIISTSLIPMIKMWLLASNRPIDHMYEYLMLRGYPVRVAYPNIVIANIRKKSTVNPKRPKPSFVDHIRRVRWEYDKYRFEPKLVLRIDLPNRLYQNYNYIIYMSICLMLIIFGVLTRRLKLMRFHHTCLYSDSHG